MLDKVSFRETEAIKATSTCGSDKSSTPASGSDPDEWLYEAAQVLLGKDAGLHLHYITGYPQSSCYAYVARDPEKRRKAHEHFLRKLFHSPQGEPFFLAFMHGCDSPWWRTLQENKRLADRARAFIASTE